ncbi:MAG TPA: hypothetical protein VMB50_06460 [Myxococcales bacterium]|nr:hypothetical protein [Myxococcales bacterium]
MPTWQEIQQYARSKYKLDDDDADFFSLVWAYDDNRSQKVIVRRFHAFDQDWLSIRSAVCDETKLDPKVALQRNGDFAVGALALVPQGEGKPLLYIMSHTVPLKDMDLDEFELPLHVIANTADNLEQTYAGQDHF